MTLLEFLCSVRTSSTLNRNLIVRLVPISMTLIPIFIDPICHNMSLIEEDTVPIIINSSNSTVQTRVYLRRWYILAVFSILGVLQVCKFYFELICHPYNVHDIRVSKYSNSNSSMAKCPKVSQFSISSDEF